MIIKNCKQVNSFQLKVTNHVTNHDFSIKFWKWKDNQINFDAKTKAKTEAEEKDGFVEVNKVYKHDSIQIKNTLLVRKK